MPNLFGLSDEAQMGLLAAALGAMSATGVKPGTALARGGLLGMSAMQNARAGKDEAARRQREDEFRQMQMDEYRRKIEEQQAQKQALSQAFQGAMIPGQQAQPPVEFGGGEGTRPGVPAQAPGFDWGKFAQTIGPHDPNMAMQALGKLTPSAQESPYAKINPKDYTLESLRVFSKTKDPSDLVARDDTKPVSRWQDIPAPPGGAGQQWQRNQDTGEIRAVGSRAPVTNLINNNYPALPPNHMWADPKDPRRGVVAIPGGPADTTKRDAIAAESKLGTADNVRAAIAEAKKFVGPLSAGLGGAVLDYPGSSAANLEEKLEPIRATLSFAELGKMREESKTGGALGQITVRELDLLSSQIASLKRRQSPAQLMKSLDDIDRRYATIQQNLEQIRSGKASPQTRGGKINSGSQQVDDLVKLYGNP